MFEKNITWTGPPIDDEGLLKQFPSDLSSLLHQANGLILSQGIFHFRGAALTPAWHSLRNALEGPSAFHALYSTIRPEDIVFGQNCVGDQFFLRDSMVYLLLGETGEVESLDLELQPFLESLTDQEEAALLVDIHKLHRQNEGPLKPGELIGVLPPLCTREAAQGVSLATIPAMERREFLAEMAAFISQLPDGESFEFQVGD